VIKSKKDKVLRCVSFVGILKKDNKKQKSAYKITRMKHLEKTRKQPICIGYNLLGGKNP